MSRIWRILSIDGGGIRGLVPATVLSAIEQRTGKPIAQLFDIIAGTSTGGILSLGLTKPDELGKPRFSAQDLRDLYVRDAHHIFHNPASWWENLLHPKYNAGAGIERVMRRNLGDTRLKDAVCDILIPCYDIEHRSPHIFKSRWARRQGQYDFSMSDVARAASATPTMFEPARLARPGAGGHVNLVDGGVFANNPALLAYSEINAMFAAKEDNFLVVSLGTGESMERMKRKHITDWGYVRWSIPMIEVVSESISEAVHEQMRLLLPPADYQRYYRFQVDLPDDTYYALDNPAKKNMDGLIEAGEEMVADPHTRQQLDRLCEMLLRLDQQHKQVSARHEEGAFTAGRLKSLVGRVQTSRVESTVPAIATGGSGGKDSGRKNRKTAPVLVIDTPEPIAHQDGEHQSPAEAEVQPHEESHYQFLPGKRSNRDGLEVVLCYAEEDLRAVVPLAYALRDRGILTTFEKFGLQPKESIRRLLSQAAETSLICMVVLSPALLKNRSASKQLEWLYSRTLSGKNVILPVVHGIQKQDVHKLVQHLNWHKEPAKYLRYLLDLAEGTTEDGIDQLADRIALDVRLWYT